MPPPDRIGFSLQAEPADGGSWVQLARHAEGIGFDGICLGDHPGLGASPFVALAALAQCTSTIQLGTAVLNIGTWTPLPLASEVATLVALSGERVVLGVGAGHNPTESTATGRPFPTVAQRVQHMVEVVDATLALLRGEVVTQHTDHVRLHQAHLCRPSGPDVTIPLLVGGNGRCVLRYAAPDADLIELTGLGRTIPGGQAHVPDWAPTAVDRRIALIEAQRGHRPYRLDALVQRCTITNSRADALHAFRAELAELMGRQQAPTMSDLVETPYVLVGSEDEILHQLRANRDRWGITRYTVRTEPSTPWRPSSTGWASKQAPADLPRDLSDTQPGLGSTRSPKGLCSATSRRRPGRPRRASRTDAIAYAPVEPGEG